MSQQRMQFEEEFYDSSQEHVSSQNSSVEPAPISYPTNVPPPMQSYVNMPDQKLQAHTQYSGQAGIGARVWLAIVSMIFVLGMFLVALVMSSLHDPVNNVASVLAILFAFVFAIVVVVINMIVNRRR